MNTTPQISAASLIGILDATHDAFKSVLAQLPESLDSTQPAGEWNARQVLSHVIGVLNRTPFQAGFFVAGAPSVPITYGNPFWQPEYEGAPRAAFATALSAAFAGNKAMVAALEPADLWKTIVLPEYGANPLAVFLLVQYQTHIAEQHVPQLRALIPAV